MAQAKNSLAKKPDQAFRAVSLEGVYSNEETIFTIVKLIFIKVQYFDDKDK